MRPARPRRRTLLYPALLLAALLSTACGQLTIRTWVKLVEAESAGSVAVGETPPRPFDRIQGGFLAVVRIDTSMPAPIRGTMALDDIRLAAYEPQQLREVCVWGNPTMPTNGTVTIDLTGTQPSGADLVLNLLATTRFSENFGIGPTALSQPASFDLGGGDAAAGVASLQMLLAAERSGSADGLFETEAHFTGSSEIAGIPVEFDLDLFVTNEGTPPSFSADLLAFCGRRFDEQGRALFWSVNSKGSYLMAEDTDEPAPPLVIDLADAGVAPGDRLRLRSVGTFSEKRELRDGTKTGLSGVFSASDRIIDTAERRRVPGAREAGSNVVTPTVTRCLLIALCPKLPTDIPEDFRIDPMVDVRVPTGATHLVVAALPAKLSYKNNSAFGFGVTLENRGP
jgi:hypothetical protein